MIETFIICIGLFIMFGMSILPAISLKSDKKETLDETIREGLVSIAFNIFMGTSLILVKMGCLKWLLNK